jgi:hypothetical protein
METVFARFGKNRSFQVDHAADKTIVIGDIRRTCSRSTKTPDEMKLFEGVTMLSVVLGASLVFRAFEPEVRNIDARVKSHPVVPLGIFDEVIQQFTHPRSAADVHVADVAKFHGMPLRLLVAGIEGLLQLPEAGIKA